jgi:AraC family transcriptional regulator
MSHVKANRAQLPAGGGPFQLEQLTIGVFLNDQPTHQLSLGSDKRVMHPLRAQEGWVLPQGAEGLCRFDEPLDVMMVGIDGRVLSEVGLSDPANIAPLIGSFDPLLLQMAMSADALGSGTTLYRETMQRALAAHVAQVLEPVPEILHDIDDQRLARAVSYIHDNLASDLRLEDMADQAAMSAYHFARAFKAETGASPLQFVISARMDAAKVLLKTTKLPVAQIAHRVGYEDLSRFGRHFKTRVGVTPKAYREG